MTDSFIIDGWEIDRELLSGIKRYGCSIVIELEDCEPVVFDFDSEDTAKFKCDQLVEWWIK